MKSPLHARIERDLLREVDRLAKDRDLTRGQVIEAALEQFLRENGRREGAIVTSPGRFVGRVRRGGGGEAAMGGDGEEVA